MKKQDSVGRMQKILISVDIGKTYSMLDLLSNSIKFAEVSRFCNIKIGSVDGYPVIIYTPSSNALNNFYERNTYDYDVTVFVTKLDSESTDQVNNLKKLLEGKYQAFFPKASFEGVSSCVDIIASQVKPYFSGKLAIQVEYKSPYLDVDNFIETKDAINKMNVSSSITSKYISSTDNSVSFQKSPEDRFFIPLPEYEIFKGETLIGQQLIPNLREIWMPFDHVAYYSPHWRKIVGKSADYRRRYLSRIDQTRDIQISEKDLTHWVDYPEDHITGNPENDDLPIMDNEIEYFNALLKFIEFDLSQNYSAEIAAKLFEEGGLTQEMEEYLEDLLEKVLILNWSCSGMFRINRFSIDMSDGEDDDMEKSLSEDAGTIAEFRYYLDTNPSGFDGIDMVKNYIKRIATGSENIKPGGCKTYVEAIIKLSRWGERRPANLKLDGSDDMFNLTRFSSCNQTVNFSQMTTKLINGRPLSLSGHLALHWVLKDKAYCEEKSCTGLISAPVGFITIKEFENSSNLSQIVYISFFDVIYEYLKGNHFINGIDLKEDGTFVVNNELCNQFSEPLVTAYGNAANLNTCTFYTSKYLEEVARETNVQTKILSDLSCLAKASVSPDGIFSRWFSELPIRDHGHLKQILDAELMSLITSMQMSVLKYILPVYLQYSDLYKPLSDKAILKSGELDFSAAINLFYEVSEKNSVSNVVGFYTTQDKLRNTVKKNKPSSSDIMVSKLTAFGETESSIDRDKQEKMSNENVEEKISEKQKNIPCLFSTYKEIRDLRQLVQVEGEKLYPVGYVATVLLENKGKLERKYLIFSKDEKPEGMEVLSAAFSLQQMAIYLIEAIGNMISDTYDVTRGKILFASTESAFKILKTYAKLKSR
jgi:hypothetical protein